MTSESPRGPAAVLTRFAVPIYLVALLSMLAPPLDLVFSMPAIELSNVRWRFGAVGLLTGAVLFPMLGLLIALMTSVACGHRIMYRIWMGLGATGMLVLIASAGLFSLDALQVRQDVNALVLRRFDLTVVKALLTQLVQIGILGALLWTGLRVGRAAGRQAAAPEDSLVIAAGRGKPPQA
ncbi:hypothetical protein BH23GEM9_BH23GEM9_23090 [soil metagenome]